MDREFVEKTIELWQEYSDGKELKTDDGIAIVRNTVALFDLLAEWEKKASTQNCHVAED